MTINKKQELIEFADDINKIQDDIKKQVEKLKNSYEGYAGFSNSEIESYIKEFNRMINENEMLLNIIILQLKRDYNYDYFCEIK